MQTFLISTSLTEAYPGTCAGVLVMRAAANLPSHAALENRRVVLEAELRSQFAGMQRADLAERAVLKAYAGYYRHFNKTYHVQLQLESILFKGKSIPSLSTLVTVMFMAEMKNQLLTAGHDLDQVQLPVTLGIATGTEHYQLLNGHEQTPKPGDMYMADHSGIISSILYGPDIRTRILPGTRNVIYTVYAPPGIDKQTVAEHLGDIEVNVRIFAPEAITEMREVF